MQRRVLIVPDKFKGTLTAKEAAQAIAAGWRSVFPSDTLHLLPMSDGGDGFGAVVGEALGARPRRTFTTNAAGNRIRSVWWYDTESRTAVIETARVIGLAMLPRGRFHPHDLDTFGLGRVFQAASRAGAKRYRIGIGGSATNDAGFGLARSLGWHFWNRDGKEIDRWLGLADLVRIQPPSKEAGTNKLPESERLVAVDVSNPLLGPRGCSRIYGPQKGLRPEDMSGAEKALRKLAEVLRQQGLRGDARQPGAGAAGGLGFGLHAFWNARLFSGFELFATAAHLDRYLSNADVVITGEGCIDASSLMGKGVGGIVALCRNRNLPCLGLGGIVTEDPKVVRQFHRLLGMGNHLTTAEEARSRPAFWLKRLGAEAARPFLL